MSLGQESSLGLILNDYTSVDMFYLERERRRI